MSSTDTPTEIEAPRSDEAREALLASLTAELGDAVVGSHLVPGDDLWVRVAKDAWADLAKLLKDGLGFGYFSFLSAIDWQPSPFGRDMDSQVDLTLTPDPDAEPVDLTIETGVAGGDRRFQVFARVNDVVNHVAITVKADVDDNEPSIASWVPVYAGASWHEREAWEMYGITFDGHPGLRNIYLPAEFEGNPLRKDFPLLSRRLKPWPGIVDVEQMPGDDEEGDS